METKMIKIRIDGESYEVESGRNLLQTCLALGFDIPYFCFHPAMGSVGACRQCAVRKFAGTDDKAGKIIMSCMEPVTDGLIISTDDPEIRAFRAAIIESLMTNHPHDCPICDEGGECHLQDMTVMTGHNYRRFSFKKRTYNNQYLGPFIHHEMNRCIQCYRCLRFYRDYSGGTDFNVFGTANRVWFGRHREGILESEFSGNLAEVCPTGVFTDKTLKEHFTRKWDLTNAPSVCVHCSLGCNTIVSERYGCVRRTMSRYNEAVNGYFLCDRGRFGYEFINSTDRIKHFLKRTTGNEQKELIRSEDYHSALKPMLQGKKLIGIGSPRASLESNFALETLVGKENFYHGISPETFGLVKSALHILANTPVHSPSMYEIGKADAIFILGEDLTNSAPMLALAVRQACRNKSIEAAEISGIQSWNDAPVRQQAQKTKNPVFIAYPFATKLDDLAEMKFSASPEEISRAGFRIASLIDTSAPRPAGEETDSARFAENVADALMNAKNPVIITGIHSHGEPALHAASNIALALSIKGKVTGLSVVFPESNTCGLGLLNGKPLDELSDRVKKARPDTLIILENNLYLRNSAEKIDPILDSFENIIVLDHLVNETALKADIVLPAATYAESTGTIINNEGRAQRYFSALPVEGDVRDSWKFLSEMIEMTGRKNEPPWHTFDDIVTSFTDSYPLFSKVKVDIPDSNFRILNEKIARQTHRFSGRTAMTANISVGEPKPPEDHDSPLAFSMEGFNGVPDVSYLVSHYWAPGWNSVQAMNKYMNEPGGTCLGGNPGALVFGDRSGKSIDYFNSIPVLFKPSKGMLMLIPVYMIFGSEELSSRAKAIAGLIPEPFLILNGKEKEKLSITQDGSVKITVNQITINVKIRIDDTAPDGIAGLSVLTFKELFTSLPGLGIPEKAGSD